MKLSEERKRDIPRALKMKLCEERKRDILYQEP